MQTVDLEYVDLRRAVLVSDSYVIHIFEVCKFKAIR